MDSEPVPLRMDSEPVPLRMDSERVPQRIDSEPGPSGRLPQASNLQDRRLLVAEQDAEFEECAAADRMKDDLTRKTEKEQEDVKYLKECLRARFSNDVYEACDVRVGFRTSGKRLVHYFPLDAPVKDLYGYVFAVGNVQPPFGLYTSFPRQEVSLHNTTLQEVGLTMHTVLSVEPDGLNFDPLVVFKELLQIKSVRSFASRSVKDVLGDEDQKRKIFFNQFSPSIVGSHKLRRSHLYNDMIALFSTDNVVSLSRFRVMFEGEKGIDTGGLSREAFSTFWELAYQKHCDGISLLSPIVSSTINAHTLQVLGRILSCGYIFCAFLPVRISFPTLSSILLSPKQSVCRNMLLDTFKASLNPVDLVSVKEAFGCKLDVFPQRLVDRLLSVFSRFDCLEVPKPANFLRLCEQSAQYFFVTKPYAAIAEIAKGVPVSHRVFWNEMSVKCFYSLFVALGASSEKVLELIEEPLMLCPSEQRVFGYLTQFVGSLNVEQTQKFLRFCTGSSVCIGKPITIAFNGISGLSRRPIAHTCDCCLELPRLYSSYPDFAVEFTSILLAEENGWLIDAI